MYQAYEDSERLALRKLRFTRFRRALAVWAELDRAELLVEPPENGRVVEVPVLGGLRHRYHRAA